MKILFFQSPEKTIYALETNEAYKNNELEKLNWLFGGAVHLEDLRIPGEFIGPRKEMITPWSTNAVEISQNMGIKGILRIEAFYPWIEGSAFDPMLQRMYK